MTGLLVLSNQSVVSCGYDQFVLKLRTIPVVSALGACHISAVPRTTVRLSL